MKLFFGLFGLSLFAATTALACPNLTGTYTCKHEDGDREVLHITQSENDGVTEYIIGDVNLKADDQERKLEEDESFREGTIRARCEVDALLISVKGKVYQEGQFFGDAEMNVNMSLDPQQNLTQVMSGSVKSIHGEFPLDEVQNCTRN